MVDGTYDEAFDFDQKKGCKLTYAVFFSYNY